jgi:elongator complex protein 5
VKRKTLGVTRSRDLELLPWYDMTLLSSVLSPSPHSRETVILIQSTFATPWLPLLHAILNASSAAVVCVCVLHPSATVLPASLAERERERVKVVDWTAYVPGYEIEGGGGEREKLLKEVQDAVDDSM